MARFKKIVQRKGCDLDEVTGRPRVGAMARTRWRKRVRKNGRKIAVVVKG